jgi:transcriptional regulator with XRE-family HTH domain
VNVKDDREQIEFYQQLGANVRARRKKLGLSQDALAQLVGLTRTSLTNIENGRQHPPLHTFCEIIEQLKVGASDLLPRRAAVTEVVDVKAMAGDQVRGDDELAFITTGIGIQQETTNGDTKKKDRSDGTDPSSGEPDHRGPGPGVQDRQGKGRANLR